MVPGVITTDPNRQIVRGTNMMAYQVEPFTALTSHGGKGGEIVTNSAPVTVWATPAPSSGERIDVVYVRTRFTSKGDISDEPEIEVATGQAANSPQPPDLPVGALQIGSARIPSGVTSTQSGVVVTDYACTSMQGSPLYVRDALPDAASLMENTRVFRLSTRTLYEKRGEKLVPVEGSNSVYGSTLQGQAYDGVSPVSRLFFHTILKPYENGENGFDFSPGFEHGILTAHISAIDPLGILAVPKHGGEGNFPTKRDRLEVRMRWASNGEPVTGPTRITGEIIGW